MTVDMVDVKRTGQMIASREYLPIRAVKIGSGAFGEVVRVLYNDPDCTTAVIKTALRPEDNGMIEEEFNVLNMLQSGGSEVPRAAPRVYHLFKGDEHRPAAYVMEDLTGYRSLMSDGRMEPECEALLSLHSESVIRVLDSVVGLLEYANKRGVAHRDIQLRNLMVEVTQGSRDSRLKYIRGVKLIDWGTAEKPAEPASRMQDVSDLAKVIESLIGRASRVPNSINEWLTGFYRHEYPNSEVGLGAARNAINRYLEKEWQP